MRQRHPGRARVLRLVRNHGPLCSYAVARLIRRSQSTARQHLRMLELTGNVRRTGAGDYTFWESV